MALTSEDLQAIASLLDKKIEPINGRLDGIGERMGGLEQRMDGIDERLDGLEQRMDGIDGRLDGLEQRMDGIDERMEGLELQLKSTERTLRNQIYKSESLILDEVERVHSILETHTNDEKKHTA